MRMDSVGTGVHVGDKVEAYPGTRYAFFFLSMELAFRGLIPVGSGLQCRSQRERICAKRRHTYSEYFGGGW